MLPEPRPEIQNLAPAVHGALDFGELERLELRPDDVLDFSVNSNPYGPSPKISDALATIPLDRYPDREALALRRALADLLGVELDRILVGNGTAELLWLVALAFLERGDRVLVIGPTFGEYERCARLMGAQVETWQAAEERGFAVEPEQVAERLSRIEPRLVFLCNPNNPTGTIVPGRLIASWAVRHSRCLFVVDEAYLGFAPGLRSALDLGADNVIVLRSMTKDYGLAGLRLGYAVGHQKVIAALARARPPWNVNALAQAAGVIALEDQGHLRRSLRALALAKEELWRGLKAVGLAPLPSATHFFLVPVRDGAAFREVLLRRGILVRDCASFGLPAYVRIASRRPEENARLLTTIREVGRW